MSDQITAELLIPEQSNRFCIDVHTTLQAWLSKTVKSDSLRARDIHNDKGKAVSDFFDWFGDAPERVEPQDVIRWLNHLQSLEKAPSKKKAIQQKDKKLKDGTIYNRMSALSGYFEYLRNDLGLKRLIPINPVKATMPKTPGRYTSEKVKALSTEELAKLMEVVENHARSGGIIHLRDNAILQLFVVTGRRRQEILSLTGESIEVRDGSFFIRTKVKGGYYKTFEMSDEEAQSALRKYLEASGRGDWIFGEPVPLWLRHYKGTNGKSDKALTSHGFAKRMMIYAREADLKGFHIHKLRHTFATMIADEFGSIADTSEALGHSDTRVTRVYVKRLKVTKDKYSGTIRRALRNKTEE